MQQKWLKSRFSPFMAKNFLPKFREHYDKQDALPL